MITKRFPEPINFFNILDSVFDEAFEGGGQYAKANIVDTESSIRVDVCLPGYEKNNVLVETDDGYLTISSKEISNSGQNTKYLINEFSIPSFKRRFKMPETVDMNTAKASFNNGILSVEFSKKEKKRSNRLIDIL